MLQKKKGGNANTVMSGSLCVVDTFTLVLVTWRRSLSSITNKTGIKKHPGQATRRSEKPTSDHQTGVQSALAPDTINWTGVWLPLTVKVVSFLCNLLCFSYRPSLGRRAAVPRRPFSPNLNDVPTLIFVHIRLITWFCQGDIQATADGVMQRAAVPSAPASDRRAAEYLFGLRGVTVPEFWSWLCTSVPELIDCWIWFLFIFNFFFWQKIL